MRRTLLTLALTAAFAGGLTAPATAAGPEVPKIPSNCHEWNQLLGIDNVRECDDPDWG